MGSGTSRPWRGFPVVVFWDQSLVWGLICIETLQHLGVPFHLLTAGEIASGGLDNYRVLLVPGGWASHKVRALGSRGREAVGRFIERGGSYLGFCGGAGLALSSPPSLGLVPLKRMGLSDRLPSASGTVQIRCESDHPAWRGLPETIESSIWWPSQFQWEPVPDVRCLAVYSGTGQDFCVADLPVKDIESHPVPWDTWESVYGINLDPKRLLGQPAVIEARLGKGRLVLSYPHLETPDQSSGNVLFFNILKYLEDEASSFGGPQSPPTNARPAKPPLPVSEETLWHLARMRTCAENLIAFGERHLLWKWRSPWLLQWQRGIRGLEYSSLAVIFRVLFDEAKRSPSCTVPADRDPLSESVKKMEGCVEKFCLLAKQLLIEERLATQKGHLSKLGSVNDSVDTLRTELFGNKMNHGGLCRTLFDQLDPILLHLLRARIRH